MSTIPSELTKDFGDIKCRRKLIELYGNSDTAYSGVNENGEDVLVSIDTTGIVVKTNQSNGWVRVNYYDETGSAAGDSYEGRWRGPRGSIA